MFKPTIVDLSNNTESHWQQNIVRGETVGGETVSGEAVSGEAVSGEAVGDETAGGDRPGAVSASGRSVFYSSWRGDVTPTVQFDLFSSSLRTSTRHRPSQNTGKPTSYHTSVRPWTCG